MSRQAEHSPDLGPDWTHRRIRPRPVQVWIDGRWINGWLTDVVVTPNGEQWGFGEGERIPWHRWVERRRIRPRRRS